MSQNTPPIPFVEVTLKLPIDVYLPVEKKATSLDITAGRLLTAFVCKSVRPGSDHDPQVVLTVVKKRKAGYDALSEADQLEFRRRAARGDSGQKLGERFSVSAVTALGWRKKLVEAGTITLPVREAPAPVARPATGRSYVRLDDAQQAELVLMFARQATTQEIVDRFGISISSASNWRRRLEDRVTTAVAAGFGVDQCQWCGAKAAGRAFQTDEHTYPAPSCGAHGHDYEPFETITSAVA